MPDITTHGARLSDRIGSESEGDSMDVALGVHGRNPRHLFLDRRF